MTGQCAVGIRAASSTPAPGRSGSGFSSCTPAATSRPAWWTDAPRRGCSDQRHQRPAGDCRRGASRGCALDPRDRRSLHESQPSRRCRPRRLAPVAEPTSGATRYPPTHPTHRSACRAGQARADHPAARVSGGRAGDPTVDGSSWHASGALREGRDVVDLASAPVEAGLQRYVRRPASAGGGRRRQGSASAAAPGVLARAADPAAGRRGQSVPSRLTAP
jgi:hypothetical protein